MEEKKIEELLKSVKRKMFVFLLICIVALGSIVFTVSKLETDKNSKCENYSKIFGTSEDVEDTYVKLNITNYAIFAEKDDTTDKFCFLIDESGDWFVAKLTKTTRDKLDSAFNEESKSFSYEIRGCISSIPYDVKSIAMESVNDWYKDEESFEKVTLLNFENYFGKNYINEGKTPNSETYDTIIGISAVVFIASFIVLIIYAINSVLEKKTIKKFGIEELKEELRDQTTIVFEKQKVYLTRNYIISSSGGLKVIKYEDILYYEK